MIKLKIQNITSTEDRLEGIHEMRQSSIVRRIEAWAPLRFWRSGCADVFKLGTRENNGPNNAMRIHQFDNNPIGAFRGASWAATAVCQAKSQWPSEGLHCVFQLILDGRRWMLIKTTTNVQQHLEWCDDILLPVNDCLPTSPFQPHIPPDSGLIHLRNEERSKKTKRLMMINISAHYCICDFWAESLAHFSIPVDRATSEYSKHTQNTCSLYTPRAESMPWMNATMTP